MPTAAAKKRVSTPAVKSKDPAKELRDENRRLKKENKELRTNLNRVVARVREFRAKAEKTIRDLRQQTLTTVQQQLNQQHIPQAQQASILDHVKAGFGFALGAIAAGVLVNMIADVLTPSAAEAVDLADIVQEATIEDAFADPGDVVAAEPVDDLLGAHDEGLFGGEEVLFGANDDFPDFRVSRVSAQPTTTKVVVVKSRPSVRPKSAPSKPNAVVAARVRIVTVNQSRGSRGTRKA